MGSATQKKMLYSGLSPLEMAKYRVLSYADRTQKGIYTELYIHHPDMGTLTPAKYRVIADKSNQGVRLSTYAMRQVAAFLSENKAYKGFISVYMPVRAMMYNHLKKILEGENKAQSYDLSRLVIEVPPEILYEDAAQVSETMVRMKEEYGVRFLLSDFCDEYCPVLRLPHYPVDYVLLDYTVDTPEAFKVMRGALNIAKQSGKKVIARINSPFKGLSPEESPDFYIPDTPIMAEGGV